MKQRAFPAAETSPVAYPRDDGWGWVYRAYDRFIRPRSRLRRSLCAYFAPNALERAGSGGIYRLLGVPYFGKIIPTGGVLIRRATGARMAPYTLAGTSIRAARDFRYRTCIFEAAHMPFLLVLVVLSVARIQQGRTDLALEDTIVNLAFNVYPIMHHRYTRLRIDRLLARDEARRGRARQPRAGPIT
jgi:hypothetical protein